MKSAIADVRAFHERFRVPSEVAAKFPGEKRMHLRIKLMTEEFEKELMPAMRRAHWYTRAKVEPPHGLLLDVSDGLADLIYVCIGTALELGIPLDRVWDEVHRSNMTKEADPNGGKVLKGPNYAPPDIAKALWGK